MIRGFFEQIECNPADGKTALLIQIQTDYSDFFPAALALAQRAFAAAEILALPAALILRLLVGAFAVDFPLLIFAHRAF